MLLTNIVFLTYLGSLGWVTVGVPCLSSCNKHIHTFVDFDSILWTNVRIILDPENVASGQLLEKSGADLWLFQLMQTEVRCIHPPFGLVRL